MENDIIECLLNDYEIIITCSCIDEKRKVYDSNITKQLEQSQSELSQIAEIFDPKLSLIEIEQAELNVEFLKLQKQIKELTEKQKFGWKSDKDCFNCTCYKSMRRLN
jgi:hypothetical protein